jgi:tyrosyl-tRNA synthetase
MQVDLTVLGRTMEDIVSLDELRARLGVERPMRIKYGVDVTAPFLHVGHAVNLWMMRYFQDGHKVIFLIGDFTTRIGDPTGRNQARKVIAPEKIETNARQFIQQVGMVLRTDPAVFEVRRNSEWYEQMRLGEFFNMLSMLTYQRLIQRDMFQNRIAAGREIFLHEMLYPVLQGYDSVMLEADLTIVGTDQLFNEMMGRFYQERFGQTPQIVITTKITPGTDGREKQSKSLGNYIALADTPRDQFGKVMSIPDPLIVPYLQVYTQVPLDEVSRIERDLRDGTMHPMEAKKRLARAIVERYHGPQDAAGEEAWFTETFSRRQVPADLPVVRIDRDIDVLELLAQCLEGKSRSDLRRLIEQGAVRLNDTTIPLTEQPLALRTGDTLKVGKRQWFRIELSPGLDDARG